MPAQNDAAATDVPVEQLVPGRAGPGCLLIHGLTGTPAEMMPVATALAGRHPLWLARVAGHGTHVRELAATSWREWYASATAGADALRAVSSRIVVIGLSMGALLAMRLAVERPHEVAGLVLLSPAIAVRRGMVRRFAVPLRALGALEARWTLLRTRLAHVIFTKGGSDIADPEVRATHPGYRHVPLRALLSLLALQRVVWRDAPAIVQRVQMIHALQDHTCPVDAARALFARLGAREKRLVLLPESFHVVTVDRERDRVLAEVTRFVDTLALDPALSSTMRRPVG